MSLRKKTWLKCEFPACAVPALLAKRIVYFPCRHWVRICTLAPGFPLTRVAHSSVALSVA